MTVKVKASDRLLEKLKQVIIDDDNVEIASRFCMVASVSYRLIYNAEKKCFIIGPEPSYDPTYDYRTRGIEKTYIEVFYVMENTEEELLAVLYSWEELMDVVSSRDVNRDNHPIYLRLMELVDNESLTDKYLVTEWSSESTGIPYHNIVILDKSTMSLTYASGKEGHTPRAINTFKMKIDYGAGKQYSRVCAWIQNLKR